MSFPSITVFFFQLESLPSMMKDSRSCNFVDRSVGAVGALSPGCPGTLHEHSLHRRSTSFIQGVELYLGRKYMETINVHEPARVVRRIGLIGAQEWSGGTCSGCKSGTIVPKPHCCDI